MFALPLDDAAGTKAWRKSGEPVLTGSSPGVGVEQHTATMKLSRGDALLMLFRVGVAGWSIPSQLAPCFAEQGTHLQRYAGHFNAVEINSSFYRPHRRATYERWAASVPPGFRFSVQLPKTITHERRLNDCNDLIERFAEETGGLSQKLGPVLVQLPPSVAYSDDNERFFEALAKRVSVPVVLEPRHHSWFEPDVDQMLMRHQVARVAADPAKVPAAAAPAGWRRLAYFRLHGSPKIYQSSYGLEAVKAQAGTIRSLDAKGAEVWTIYDNTTYGAAVENASRLLRLVAECGT